MKAGKVVYSSRRILCGRGFAGNLAGIVCTRRPVRPGGFDIVAIGGRSCFIYTMKISDLESAVEYLKSFTSYEDIIVGNYDEKAFDLCRFKKFLRKYGVKYERVRAIHIAGSKGKGTTASLIASYLRRQGYRVGLFTSPYVLSITDSIEIDGVSVPEKRFLEYVNDLRRFVEKERLVEKGKMVTYFELLTTIMFKYFLDSGVDFAVLEVGLGGRLDSTNVCRPVSTVLTSVEKEHEKLLGDTYAEILGEKLGIVKKGVPLIVAPQNAYVMRVLSARRWKVPVVWAHRGDPNYEGAKACLLDLVARGFVDEFDERLFLKIYHDLSIVGRFDVEKFKVSGRAGGEAGYGKAVAGVSAGAGGRQVGSGGQERVAVFDIAHTVGSGKYLRAKLESKFSGKRFVFLISMMKDKDVDGFLDEVVGKDFVGRFRSKKHRVVFTSSHPVRGYPASELKSRFCKEARVVEDPVEAFRELLSELECDQILVVTGSHFLVGEVLRAVRRGIY